MDDFLIPKRPARTSQRENRRRCPPRFPPPRVFSERPMRSPGVVLRIWTTTNRLHIGWFRDGVPGKAFRFAEKDLHVLEPAGHAQRRHTSHAIQGQQAHGAFGAAP